MASSPTLETAFDPRANALNFLRLLLAGAIVFGHGALFAGHGVTRPLDLMLSVPLDGFFALSGFLIARSWDRRPSWPHYLWHRFLRIMPAFWACLAVTAFVLAPLGTWRLQGSLEGYWDAPNGPWRYLWANALLCMRQYTIGPTPTMWDGALWTLYWEFLCYLGLGVLGVLGVMKKRRWIVLALLGFLWVLLLVEAFSPGMKAAFFGTLRAQTVVRLSFMFLCGTALYLYRERIPLNGRLAWLAFAVFAVGFALLPDSRLVGIALAYGLLWLAIRLPVRVGMRTDVSYGLYIYAFPVQQLVLWFGAASLGWPWSAALGVLATLPLAFASWYGVERWALRLKGWSPGRRGLAGDRREPPAAQGGLSGSGLILEDGFAVAGQTRAWAVGVAVMVTVLALDVLALLRGWVF
jgi:peptidoglycan/LPS O-acetylase OafA/YrhL